MADPIIATLATGEITNNSVLLRGESFEYDDWECIKWGFYYDKETPLETYADATETPGAGIFSKLVGSLDPYTFYYYQAYGKFKKWVPPEGEEEGYWEYIEKYGMMENFTTHAYCKTLQIFACNINKSTLAVVFHGSINDNEGDNCVERGFEFGLTKTKTWEVHENGNFPEEMFSIPAYNLPPNCDLYVRTYLKSASGHYAYTADGDDRGWAKFTTKIKKYQIAVLSNAGYFPTLAEDFLRVFDENGQEVNAWKLPVGQMTNEVTVDMQGNAFYGYVSGGNNYVAKRRLRDGVLLNSWAITGFPRGITLGMDNSIYILEEIASDNKKLYKRNISDFTEISHIDLVGSSSYLCGIAADEFGHVYIGRTSDPDRIEGYGFYTSHEIIGVISNGPGEGSFKIAGKHVREFTDLEDVMVSGSTGNDGDYTVKSGGAYLEDEDTIIPVVQSVSDPTPDGNIILKGSLTMFGSQNSPKSLMFGGIAISEGDEYGAFIYAGAYLDLPVKTVQYLFEIESWAPAGTWYNDWFYHVGNYKKMILVEGTPLSGFSRALAGYDSDRNLLWQVAIVRGIESINGYPFLPTGAILVNVKAEKRAGSLTLYGEITEIEEGSTIVERGFEYKIQDEEPEIEDTGTEIKETGNFIAEEYHLSNWDTYNDLYCAEEDKIWWFRAYCKDNGDNKYKAETWMKNIPILVTNECTETTAFSTKGRGELTDVGANIVTERGFHVIKEFSGNLFELHKYTYHDFIVLSMESITQYAPNGALIGWLYVGELLKVVSTENTYGYPPEEYELDIGTGILKSLLPNDIYKVKAFGKNELGRGFGEEVEVNTLQIITEPFISDYIFKCISAGISGIIEPDWVKIIGENTNDGTVIWICEEGDKSGIDKWIAETEYELGDYVIPSEPILSPITMIKTVKVNNLPEGYKVVRIGIKYGRTPSCNEGMVYEDGEWYGGDSVTFFIVDLIPGEKYYESPFFIIEDDTGDEDEIEDPDPIDEFPPIELPEFPGFPDIESPLSDLAGIDYNIIIREIKCSIIADQSIIDKYGRRRTLTIRNNLIQTKEFCISVRDNYLNRFQELKLKIDIDYDIPLPFEREDTILLAYGQINYKTDGNGVIGAKADGEGVISGKMSILTKIRKININAKPGEAILTLELEV